MEIQGYEIPTDLYYDPEHYWVRPEGDELVLGMTDFAQKLAGDIVFVQLPDDGKKLKKGKKLAKVESGKWLGKIMSPVDGVLVTVNEELETQPGLINRDPYGAGWMYRIKPEDMGQIEELIHGEEAIREWMEAEIAKHGDEGKQ
jgi:glycine cleavage system H protein